MPLPLQKGNLATNWALSRQLRAYLGVQQSIRSLGSSGLEATASVDPAVKGIGNGFGAWKTGHRGRV